MATIEIHVTRISGRDVYGHPSICCDETGCAGTERYYPQIDATEVAVGDTVDVVEAQS